MKILTKKEQKNINGGIGFWATIAAGTCIGAAVEIIQNWDEFKTGIKRGRGAY